MTERAAPETGKLAPSPKWRGAWPADVLQAFRKMTSEEAIRATEAGLFYDRPGMTLEAMGSPETAREKRIIRLLSLYRAHDGYKRLNADQRWRRSNSIRAELASRNALFGDPYGEMRLARIAATLIGIFDPRFKPKRATLARQRLVRTAVRKLLTLMMPGAQLPDWRDHGDLSFHLNNLLALLDASIRSAEEHRTRPFRGDHDAARRYWMVNFCKLLIERFGEAPISIVQEVASMVGYELEDATVARYVATAIQLASRESSSG